MSGADIQVCKAAYILPHWFFIDSQFCERKKSKKKKKKLTRNISNVVGDLTQITKLESLSSSTYISSPLSVSLAISIS